MVLEKKEAAGSPSSWFLIREWPAIPSQHGEEKVLMDKRRLAPGRRRNLDDQVMN